ncbi:MAG: YukJ family protein [Chlorobiaceae bacterium]|nr:YukJ family protein [Chlorobiaceae bacterium]
MPLFDGYGMLVGRLSRYSCDKQQDDAHYYHCMLVVQTPGGMYRCAVDLDSKHRRDGIQWKVVEIPEDEAAMLIAMPDGWHYLAMDDRSGALDYYRSASLAPCAECVHASRIEGDGDADVKKESWKYGTGHHAFRDLEVLLKNHRRIFVFGEPFRNGRGVHNIHQNQGDPPDSPWAAENGAWQDGAVMVERADGTVAAFLCKFSTQRFCVEEEAEKAGEVMVGPLPEC